jgi:hypothetical protein
VSAPFLGGMSGSRTGIGGRAHPCGGYEMRIAIALTLLLGAAAMAALVIINLRQYRHDGKKRAHDAMIVSGVLGFWCFVAAVWMLLQDW